MLSNPHSTYRDIRTREALWQWQTELDPHELHEIEQNCADVMRQFGYKPLNQCIPIATPTTTNGSDDYDYDGSLYHLNAEQQQQQQLICTEASGEMYPLRDVSIDKMQT